jgi:hypothetical protein
MLPITAKPIGVETRVFLFVTLTPTRILVYTIQNRERNAMCPRLCLLALGTLLVIGCSSRTTGIAIEGTIQAVTHLHDTHLDPFSTEDGVTLIVEPLPFPETFSVGDGLLVRAKPLLKTGAECEQCSIRWCSSNRDVACWTAPVTACTRNQCSYLRILASGNAKLSVELCPGQFRDCVEFEIANVVCNPPTNKVPSFR